MIRNWFRSKRQLIAGLDRQRDMLANRDAQITELSDEIDLGYGRAIESMQQLQRERDSARRAHDATRDQLAKVREELERLREEIAHLERGDRPTFGMARPLDRPLVWQTADAIREDAAHVRREDV